MRSRQRSTTWDPKQTCERAHWLSQCECFVDRGVSSGERDEQWERERGTTERKAGRGGRERIKNSRAETFFEHVDACVTQSRRKQTCTETTVTQRNKKRGVRKKNSGSWADSCALGFRGFSSSGFAVVSHRICD